jgi:hypothetical protein
MTSELLQTVIAASSLLVIALTMYVFMRQYRAMTEATRFDSYQSLTSNLLVIDQLLMQQPHLRKFIYDGVSMDAVELDADERARIQGLVELMADFFDNVMVQKDCMPKDRWPQWRSYIVETCATSPDLCAYLCRRKEWYDGQLHELLAEGLCLCREETVSSGEDSAHQPPASKTPDATISQTV